MRRVLPSVTLFLCLVGLLRGVWADVPSGPMVGQPVDGFQVDVVTGESAGQTINPVETRTGKTTVYAFVPHDKWSRPSARFLRALDGELSKVSDARMIVVWLSPDVGGAKDYLPKAQQSLKFEHTDLTVFAAGVAGPNRWGINDRAHVTIVVVDDRQSVATFGFVSVNETAVGDVMKVIQPSSN